MHSTFIAIVFAALLALTLILASPAEAQGVANTQYEFDDSEQEVQGSGQQAAAEAGEEDDAQATTRATDPLAGETATLENRTSNGGDAVDLITIEVADCIVQPNATVTVESGNQQVEVSGSQNDIDTTADGEQVTITGPNGDDIVADNIRNLGAGTGNVISSTGITCGRDDDGNDGSNNANPADDGAGDGDGDDARTAEELQDLSCEALLAQFRAGSGSAAQYGDAVALADADVQARIEVCLEQEVVEGTAAGEDLPDTGGVSLLGLAVLGVVSAAAGLFVIRGDRRRDG